MKVNANPMFPQRFLAMEEPPLKILIDFYGGRRKSPYASVSRERSYRERVCGGEIKE
jgi:hypothetical protein